MVTGLLVAAGLVMDVGSWYTDRSALQQGVDASAVSGAQFYATQSNPAGPTPPGSACPGSKSATACAIAVGGINGIKPTSQTVTTNGLTGVQVTASDKPTPFFANLFGISPTVSATATASTIGPSSAQDFLPLALTVNAANNWRQAGNVTLTYNSTDVGFAHITALGSMSCVSPAAIHTCLQFPSYCACSADTTMNLVVEPPGSGFWTEQSSDWNDVLVADGRPVVMPVYDPTSLAVLGFATVEPIASGNPANKVRVRFVRVVTSVSDQPPAPYFGTGSISITR